MEGTYCHFLNSVSTLSPCVEELCPCGLSSQRCHSIYFEWEQFGSDTEAHIRSFLKVVQLTVPFSCE